MDGGLISYGLISYGANLADGSWLSQQNKAGVLPHEFGIFVRAPTQLHRARADEVIE